MTVDVVIGLLMFILIAFRHTCWSLNERVVEMSYHDHIQAETADHFLEKGSDTDNFSFASYYGSHMVLQRAPQRANIWGYHPTPGTDIIIQVLGRQTYKTKVKETNRWSVLLEAESSSGPFTIVAMTESQTITLEDVLFGDVWLCSGQSNMAFTLDMVFNGTTEIEEAKYYQSIRLFTAGRRYSLLPLDDLLSVAENWSLPNNDTLGRTWEYFSAVCWLYGKALYQQLGYPIGLINTVWGGTYIQSWMSPDALHACGIPFQRSHFVETRESAPVPELKEEILMMASRSAIMNEYSKTQLWNAMINPFLPLTLYGVIWDQGENDGTSPETRNLYNCTFPAMIDDWRAKFSKASLGQTSPTFPFGFVQIGSTEEAPEVTEYFTDIRWHQTADYGYVPNPRMKNIFMAVSLDISDFDSPYSPVHTRDKQDIAQRLALGGLSVAYGMPRLWQGPLPTRVRLTAGFLVLDYGSMWTLEIRQSEGFDVCCSPDDSQCGDSNSKAVWVPCPITGKTATSILLYAGVCGDRDNVAGLRYLWRLSPCSFKLCAVYSRENELPAAPFIMPRTIFVNGSWVDIFANVTGSWVDIDWSKPVNL